MSEYDGPPLGSLLMTQGHKQIPDNSLVRIVAEETDNVPAVEVLIPAGEMGSKAPFEEIQGHELVQRYSADNSNDGQGELSDDINEHTTYYWCDLRNLKPLNNKETDNEDQ